MDAQTAFDVLAKVLPIVLDVAAMVPGVGIPVGAIKVAEDVISIEEGAHTWLTTTPQGRQVWAKVEGFAGDLGHSLALAPQPGGGAAVVLTAQGAIDLLRGEGEI